MDNRNTFRPKAVIFDLDGTLAPYNAASDPQTCRLLHELENRGVRIGVCSGKPLAYLCGYMRQIGLKEPILLGENGADIQLGIVFPPKVHIRLSGHSDVGEKLHTIRKAILEEIPDIWFQANMVELTPFFKNEDERLRIRKIIYSLLQEGDGIHVYEFCDCFDLVPEGISKREGLETMCRLLSIRPEDTVAVGDGTNDYPMFDACGHSVGIGIPETRPVDYNAPDIGTAMEYILSLCGGI